MSTQYFPNSSYVLEIVQSLESQNVLANSSKVNVVFRMRKLSGTGYYSFNSHPVELTVDGSKKISTSLSYDFRNYSTLNLWSGTVDVGHSNNGQRSCNAVGTFSAHSSIGYARVDDTLALPTIPRATIPRSASSFDLDTVLIVHLPRADPSFTHTVTLTTNLNDGGKSDIVTLRNQGAASNFKLTESMIEKICKSQTKSENAQLYIYVLTYYSNGSIVGAHSIPVMGVIPKRIVPAFEKVVRNNTEQINVLGGVIKGLTEVSYGAHNPRGKYGSTIVKVSVKSPNYANREKLFTAHGNQTISLTITDSRGRTATKTTVEMVHLAPEIAANISVVRCNENGVEDLFGSYAKMSGVIKATKPSLETLGWSSYTFHYKETTATKWISINEKGHLTSPAAIEVDMKIEGTNLSDPLSSGISPVPLAHQKLANMNPQKSYDVMISFSIRSNWIAGAPAAKISLTVPTAEVLFDLGKEGVGIGKVHQRGGIDIQGPAYHDNGIPIVGLYDLAPEVKASNFNDLWRKGVFRFPNSNNANAVINSPKVGAGYLEVETLRDYRGNTENDFFLCIVQKYTNLNGEIYQRNRDSGADGRGKWTPWRRIDAGSNDDYVIEHGKNANGEWWKYESGRMVQQTVLNAGSGSSVAWGAMHYQYFSDKNWVFPQPFIEVPAYLITGRASVVMVDSVYPTQLAGINDVRPVSSNFQGGKRTAVVEGRWK